MNHKRIYWIMHISCWLLIAKMALKYSLLVINNYHPALQYFSAVFIFGVVSTHCYKLIVDKYQTDNISIQKFLLFPIIGNIVVGLLFLIVDSQFTDPEYKAKNYTDFSSYFSLYLDDFWVITPWFFFFHFLRYAAQKQIINERFVSMEKMIIAAELETLKTQLHPHFFFNALNSIKALMIIDHEQARSAVDQLSDLLRLSLNIGQSPEVRISEELKLSKAYLFLEKIRFDKRLQYTIDVEEGLSHKMIIPMSISTLIENAIKHGIAKQKAGGDVSIKIFQEDNFIKIQVSNSGTFNPEPQKNDGGIGLSNLKKRVELKYKGEASLEIKEIDNRVVALLCIPVAKV